jgi:hypothetical protein
MRPLAASPWLVLVLLHLPGSLPGAGFDGTYRASRLLPLGAGQNFAAGSFDLDLDGREDLVITLRPDEAAVLLATPAGFAPPVRVPGTHTEPYHAASGFLDADGIPDLAVVSRAGARVLFGDGDGTFREGPLLRSLFFGRIAIIARVDADEHVDILLADEIGGVIRVHAGDGQGGFVHARDVTPGDEPHDLDAADLNGDGNLDLVCPHGVSDTVSVLLGKGDGTFERARAFPVGSNNRNTAIADIDLDGDLDVVVSNRVTSTASILPGEGDGNLGAAQPISTVAEPNAAEAADLTADGIPDLLVAGGSSDGLLGLHIGTGSGAFRPVEAHRTGTAPLAVAAGDWDLDGATDALVSNSESTFATLFRGAPGGGLVDRASIDAGGDPVAVIAARLDADTRHDIVAAVRNSTSIATLLSAGAGLQGGRQFPLGMVPAAIATADFHPDGLADLAAVDAVGTVVLRAGFGDGTFDEPSASRSAGILPSSAAAADLDGDGRLDLAVSNEGSSDISFFAGDGGGRLAAAVPIPAGDGPIQVLAADLDRDGKTDLITLNGGSKDLSIILRGESAFLPAVRVAAGSSPAAVASGDLGGDGAPDLVVADAGADAVIILEGKGGGSFEDGIPVPTGPAPSALALTDPAGDGFPDVAVACPGADAVFIHPNDGGDLAPATAYSTGRAPRAIAAADVTGDGAEDLVTADSLGGAISLIAAGSVLDPAGTFRRGEATGDGAVNISDPIAILQYLFGSGAPPRCIDAGDATDDGAVNITDPIFLLNYLFLGTAAPPDPGPDACGPDPTADELAECTAPCTP